MNRILKVIVVGLILLSTVLPVAAQDDSQLLQDAAELCTLGKHEASDIALLRQCAKRFAISQVDTMATMLENRLLDISHRQGIAATSALLRYAEQHYGETSREAVVCRRQVMSLYSDFDWSKADSLCKANRRCAERLCRQRPKDKDCRLLSLVVRLEDIIVQKQRDEDNPNHWAEALQIEKELEPYFGKTMTYSSDLVYACYYLASFKTYEISYQVYVNDLIQKTFPKGCYMAGRMYSNDVFLNMEGFMQHAVDGAKALWGENDLRTIGIERDQAIMQMRFQLADFNTLHDRFSQWYSYLYDYLPQGDPAVDQMLLLMWECDARFQQKTHEIRSPYPILSRTKAFYGEFSMPYLDMHLRLANIYSQVDAEKASPLLQDAEAYTDALLEEGSDIYGAYLLAQVYPMQSIAQQDNQRFQKYLTKLTNYYEHHHRPSWESVLIGRNLATFYSQALMLNDKAATIMQTAVADIKTLAGYESVVYASCLNDVAKLFGQTPEPESLRRAVSLCREAIKLYETLSFSVAFNYHSLASMLFSLGQKEEALQTLRTGISKCRKQEDGMWRCLMQLQLGWELYNYNGQQIKGEPQQLFEEAIPFFNAHIEEAAGAYMEGFSLISNYYQVTQRLDKAEEVLKRGMALHETLYGEYDYIYTQMLTDLYSLYAFGLSDMDKAEQLLEGRVEALRQQHSFSMNYTLLQLLWQRYQLLSSKTNDWMLRFTALNEITEQMKSMVSLAGASMSDEDKSNLRNIALPVIYEYTAMFPIYARYMKEAQQQIDNHTLELTQEQLDAARRIGAGVKEVGQNVLSMLQEVESELKARSQSYLDNPEALDLYVALANYYIGIEQDTVKAMSYYQLLAQSNSPTNRFRALSELALLNFDSGRYDEAARLYEQQQASSQFELLNLQNKAGFYNLLGRAYQLGGRHHEAIGPAREFFRLRRQFAEQNFDLLTQTERESFIQNGGVGSNGVLSLLPRFPAELSSDAYDAMLASKGLLLRASERIKKAIFQSGNPLLKAQLDSLNQLNARYKTMNTQVDWEHGNFNFEPATIQLRQQIEALERSINRQASQFIEGMNTPDWHQLQHVLHEGEAAVEYVLSDTASCGALVLLPKGEPLYVHLTNSNELWKALDALKDLNAERKAEALYQVDRLQLYTKLWKPLETALKGVKTVYYSPTGYLNDLAFAAFKLSDGSYLTDHYELHQMLSTGDLVALRNHPDNTPVTTASLYGAVYYSPSQEALAQQIAAGAAQRGMAYEGRGAIQDEEETFGFLPFTKQEIQQVDQILHQHQISTTLMSGFMPTEQALHAISNGSPQVLHLSTHGFFVPGNRQALDNKFLARFPSTRFSSMQRSGLALVGANSTWEGATDKPEASDGILTANEVALLDLSNTRLAVLSACQTAVGEYSIEGVYGMHRGFKQAGVKSILATLWNVNDKSTARLMELFYQYWLSGIPMQQSLNKAMAQLREEYPSPFFWAPFVLMDAAN